MHFTSIDDKFVFSWIVYELYISSLISLTSPTPSCLPEFLRVTKGMYHHAHPQRSFQAFLSAWGVQIYSGEDLAVTENKNSAAVSTGGLNSGSVVAMLRLGLQCHDGSLGCQRRLVGQTAPLWQDLAPVSLPTTVELASTFRCKGTRLLSSHQWVVYFGNGIHGFCSHSLGLN